MTRDRHDTALVLVHGAGHDARCWKPTVDAIRARSDRSVLAVDLPGRGSRPGPLRGLHVADYVDAVVDQITAADLDRIVLVGHSMAGLIVPGVAAALPAGSVVRTVLVAANVAPTGGRSLDTLRWPSRWAASLVTRWPAPYRMPKPVARSLFCNGMTEEQTRFVTDRLVPEAGWLARERIEAGPGHQPPPVTWVFTRNDRAVSPRWQREAIAAIGGVDELVELAAPHDVMVSHPEELADALLAAGA